MISFNPTIPAVQHGGNIGEAIKRYRIPKEQWIDLSSGISPWIYPIKPLPEYVWQELPASNKELITVAAKYYGVQPNQIIATPGSQIAIRLIPQFFSSSHVAIPALGYKEHAASWQMANHEIIYYQNMDELFDLIEQQRVEHIVLINPNNPSGEKIDLNTLEKISAQLTGVCLIDEAFIDYYASPDSKNKSNTSSVEININSATKMAHYNDSNNLIILRSIGKFFGLGGIRLGFAMGTHPKLSMLNGILEPWSINHASQHIGIQALEDTQWQLQQRTNIQQQQKNFNTTLKDLLTSKLETYSITETGLFTTAFSCQTALKKLHTQLAERGIWTRLGNQEDQPSWLRFGLPDNIDEFNQRR